MDDTVQPGTYTMVYELCNLSNCETAEVEIVVAADIAPEDDSGTGISGTASTPVANVAANDNVNGQPADITPTTGNATVVEKGVP